MAAKFTIKKATDGQFFFHLQAANGEIILRSELYKAKSSAENGIASVQRNAPDDARYERKVAKNGEFMFNLKAANHEVIGTSELYKNEAGRENGIASVKQNAPGARTDDQS
ncbi:YegP family protein [Burkholderia alba]|uniref:YegP family protein n=1 Tax=Burkholderia alba TaxID=2683677 RepID=UPI002B057744|nr:YegP family protein [Burkholderia alba]